LDGIYQHFREDEHTFIDQVIEWKDFVERQYSPKLTDFLDPREQFIANSVIGSHSEVQIMFFGGNVNTERKRALLYPVYFEPTEEDFHLAAFEIDYPKKFITLEHRHILGSLMSLGLKRTKYGDIIIQNHRIQIIVAKEIEHYVQLHFNEVGKTPVSLLPLSLQDIIIAEKSYETETKTISSLRLDAVCSAILKLSRQKTKPLIQNGYVKVNWKVIEDPSFEIMEGDIISVRGFGRSKVMSIEGKTKKDKLKVTIGKQK
jgi:RNA-binding protein YlmH